jgi:CubicO group peptidase (beta-lactamase class C family)
MSRTVLAVAVAAALAHPAGGQETLSPEEKVVRKVEELMREHKVPGVSVAVVEGGKLAWARGFGVREAGQPEKVDADTVFQMASVSKPVAGLGAMVLASKKAIDLDADVNTILKSWRVPKSDAADGETVTLRRLLGHRAGTTIHGFPGYAEGKPVPTLVQVLDGKPPANTKPVVVDRKPGSGMRYSGGGYCVAQLALTDATGKPFPALMDELVLTPLKMTRSTYEQPPPEKLRANLATAHGVLGKPVPGRYHVYPEMAAAGLWSTPTDLAKLIVAVSHTWAGKPGAILPADRTREMFATGVGWPVLYAGDKFTAAHGGSNRGYQCVFVIRPATGQGAVILTNSDRGAAALTPALKAIREAYKW